MKSLFLYSSSIRLIIDELNFKFSDFYYKVEYIIVISTVNKQFEVIFAILTIIIKFF